jgi:hypothetical protein
MEHNKSMSIGEYVKGKVHHYRLIDLLYSPLAIFTLVMKANEVLLEVPLIGKSMKHQVTFIGKLDLM